ncbi:MAG: lamin tail domain-containing protein [bacterium]
MKCHPKRNEGYVHLKILAAIITFMFICLTGLAISSDSLDIHPASAAAALFINEFMADNASTIDDPAEPGAFEDWIEIYNSGDVPGDMSGMYLTDDPADPTKWQVPSGVSIPPQGFLLFWADDDEERGQGFTHTSFKLSKSGEVISLLASDGTLIDSIEFGAQLPDVSYGRCPDGGTGWGFMAATPGAANDQHNAPPIITGTTHTPLSPAGNEPVWVTCSVVDEDGTLVSVILAYDPGTGPAAVSMYDDGEHQDGKPGDGSFGGRIPGLAQNTLVRYFITATDNLEASSHDPVTSPLQAYLYLVGYTAPPLFINEFMADNAGTIEDPTEPGIFEDWIEIYNAGDGPVDMVGMYLTDDLTDPAKWQVPAGVSIPPQGFLLFWADEGEAPAHAGFRLNKGGDEIGLFDTDGKRNMRIDTIRFGDQNTDMSYGRIYDGGEPWMSLVSPSPGSTNYFPAGTYAFTWNFSHTMDSYTLIRMFGSGISTIRYYHTSSGKWEVTSALWSNPSGDRFSLQPDGNYVISITSPSSVSFRF